MRYSDRHLYKKEAYLRERNPGDGGGGHFIGRTAIADLKNPDTGKIGKQGFTRVGVEQLINHATGIEDYAKGRSLKETLDALRSDPWGMTKVDEFLERTPIETSELPDGLWLQDGHHRAFLADQIGKKDLPSRTKRL